MKLLDYYNKLKKKLNTFQIIILGFFIVIFLGACLLTLPIATNAHIVTPFSDAFFTATSAVCVTGLVVKDTASYWSMFGQVIILLLIQIGGLGVVTVAASFALFSGRRISLMQRSTLQEAMGSTKIGGMVRLTGFILKATFCFELLGAFLLLPTFAGLYEVKGLWMAIFHSISAFCNAGFDILGTPDNQFVSLTAFANSPVIVFTIMSLIIIGGIGFLTWDDMVINKHHFHKYHMQSKVILTTTACLIIFPAIIFYFLEFTNYPLPEGILRALFQSVTPRTAGFNTSDLNAMSDISKALTIVLMLIGGSPGSTAGGIKTTTFAVIIATFFSAFRREEDIHFFGRRIDFQPIRSSIAILLLYIALFFIGGTVIAKIESLPLEICLYETASALGTVGLTLGITSTLGEVSKFILILLMFFGRVGGLTLIYATLSARKKTIAKLPHERITVG